MIDATGMPQSAVVLGGSSDIARALLTRLAERRLRQVLLAGRDAANLETAVKELQVLVVPTVDAVAFDVTDTARARGLAADAAVALGQIDLVVMAVGMLGEQEHDEHDPEATARVLATNTVGPAAALVAFADVLRAQGAGRLVVLSSVAGVRVRRANFVYGASKAGLDGFAQGLGESLRGSGAGVTIVRAGWVATRMTAGRSPAPMATTPGAVAADIVRGLERSAAVVWSPAKLRWVMGPVRLLPTPLWRRLPG
jgi:decaprenylphospho-beta-D-erythro-pentofuranosid-2-ulose 2-reductase